MSQTREAAAWWRAAWVRIVAAILAVATLLYGVLVPAALAYLAIGSAECLGPLCARADQVVLVAGVVGVVASLAGAVLLIWTAARPRVWSLSGSIACLLILPFALVAQVWAASVLVEGRAHANDALQLGYSIDSVVQEAVMTSTGLSPWNDASVLGPDISVAPCSDLDEGFVALVTLHFGPGAGIDAGDRERIATAIHKSTTRRMLIPDSLSLVSNWSNNGEEQTLTVRSSCQPLPQGE